MPPPPAPDFVHNLLQYTQLSATTLHNLSDATGAPFLRTVAGLTLSIVSIVQDVKTNKERCVRMVQETHQLLCALVTVCVKSEHSLSPKMLDHIGSIAQTLQKFQACLRSQQELGKIKRFFKQNEITTMLEVCEAELIAALDLFHLQSGAQIAAAIVELEVETEQRHQELLELLETQSDDTGASIRESLLQLSNSSSALSMLPAFPKLFNGRDSDLENVVAALLTSSARIAVLGTGGIGKTTLAIAALYHPSVVDRYPHRHFVSCESASNCRGLVSIIGSHLGLEASSQLTKAILRHFSESAPSMLVLDNLETPWEPAGSRGEVEEFLSLLTDVSNLGLLVTMRGSERPGKVRWTRPFLHPLKPLHSTASRKTFIEIADDPSEEEEADLAQLIDLSGNLPLAISLMANVASFEGYSTAVARWNNESTALLSDGHDKRSNLDKSISMSLTSPRMAASASAKDLLSLLSLLPDGISDEDLRASDVPIPDLAQCKSVLLRTALAFVDNDKRLKMLSPIREYYFHELLDLWNRHKQLSSGDLVSGLISHLGNMHKVFFHGLADTSQLASVGRAILALEIFSAALARGSSPLIQYLPDLIESTGDNEMRWTYFTTCIKENSALEPLFPEAIEYFAARNDLAGQANIYNRLAAHYEHVGDYPKAREFNALGLASAIKADSILQQLAALTIRPYLERLIGNYTESLEYARSSQRAARLAGSLLDESVGLVDEAKTLCCLGKLSQALDLCKRSNELLSANVLGDYATAVEVHDAEAEIHFQKSEYVEARKSNERVLALTAHNRSPYYHNNAMINLAEIDIAMGCDETEILRTFTPAQELSARLGWARGLLFCKRLMSGVYLVRKQPAEARESYIQCLRAYRTGNMAWGVMKCLEKLADLAYGMQEVHELLTLKAYINDLRARSLL
ncbi:NB-ARC domain-containing protein [Mycena sanguinolenta]|uniref:NB-ARC domain-containing protein n=1 Tax=Mycena sanguinolenta TaxID=230812 RepID=A0A8H6Z4R5_9AGAR|nr:NB-ARC domain-containing protein [Mycena sanguinolenta]